LAVEKVGGYMGKILRVDLGSERISEETLDSETLRKYVGGTGFGTKYLYEEVPPGVEWSDADNRMMFFTGPLAGTKVSGSGTFSVVSKGPMTNFAGASQANGYFGAFLKFSGFDGVVVQGKAKKWLYLHIHDGTAELLDAGHLQGKDTWETEDTIKQGISRQCSVFSIGPAGENLVRFACICGDRGHVVSHNGLGAVMGSKKLKAIVAERGRKKVPIAQPDQMSKAAEALYQNAVEVDPNMGAWGTAWIYPKMVTWGMLPIKNYTTSIWPIADRFSGEYLRTHFKATKSTCWACRIAHCRMTEVTEGPYTGFVGEEPEYEGLAAMSSVIGQTDPGATVMLGNNVDRLGMDINESGYLMGWIMECYEKGFIKKEDLDGVEMKWGDAEATLAMLKKTAHRQGSGNLWAEGVKKASEKIGGEAADCAIYARKGATPRGHDHRARWAEMVDTCLSNTGTIEVGPGVPYPQQLGLEPPKDPFDPIETAVMNAKVSGRRQFEDCLGVCFFCMQNLQMEVDAVNAVTGWDFDIWAAMDVGRRIVNQLRVFSFRHGLTKDIEAPSVRYGSSPVDGPAQGKFIMPHWESLRSAYYQEMGWDADTGKPLPETLERLGLGHIFRDLKV
jgi:aldehyde:ferredoxin oxidoreductase